MALIDLYQHWMKLEADGHAEIGNDFNVGGSPSFVPEQFGNGAYSNNNINYLEGIDPIENVNAYVIEKWIDTDWQCISGASQDGAFHSPWWMQKNNTNRFHMRCYTTLSQIEVWHGGIQTAYTINTPEFSWNIHAKTHLMFVFNSSGIAGGAHKLRIYVNGSLAYSSTASAPVASVHTGWTMKILRDNYSYDLGENWKGAIDNMKIGKESATQLQENIDKMLANSVNEGFPVSGRAGMNKFNRVRGGFNI